MPETTLRVRTQAELSGLREYIGLLREAGPLARDLRAASGRGRGGDGRGGGGGGRPEGTGGAAGDGGGSDGSDAGGGGFGPRGRSVHEMLFGASNSRRAGTMDASESIAQQGGLMGMGKGQLLKLGAVAGGVALGGGLLGMLLGAGQQYIALSQILQVVEQRFQSTGRAAAFFGRELGFTIAKTAPMLEALGAGTNTVTEGQFANLAGYGRWRGLDPQVMMGLGAAGGRRGARYGQQEILSLHSLATQFGMSEGRLPEHLAAFGSLAESSFRALGREDTEAVLAAQRAPGAIFGFGDPRAQGERGADFASRLHGVLAAPGAGMKSYMMRAMGFGAPGGPDYVTMRKRMEAGVFDKRNIVDLFGMMSKQGMTQGQMFRGLEEASGGKLAAHELEALTKTLGTERGRRLFSLASEGDRDALGEFAGGLSPEDRKVFEKVGLPGLGETGIAAGEYHELLQEGRTLKYGPKSLQIQDQLLQIGDKLVDLLGRFVTGDMIGKGVEAIDRLITKLDEMTNPHQLPDPMKDKTVWGQAVDLVRGATVDSDADTRAKMESVGSVRLQSVRGAGGPGMMGR